MSAEIINLRQARKQAKRDRKVAQTRLKTAGMGQTKAERLRQQAEAERAQRMLDGSYRNGEKS